MQKECANCKQITSDYYIRKNGKFHSWCKTCTKLKAKNIYLKNRKEKLAYANEYRELNKHTLSIKTLVRNSRNRANKKDIEFNLHWTDIYIPNKCPILGIPLMFNYEGIPTDNSPSLDRIDPTKGYTKDNVWVISNLANRMKSNADAKTLRDFAKWVLENIKDDDIVLTQEIVNLETK